MIYNMQITCAAVASENKNKFWVFFFVRLLVAFVARISECPLGGGR